VKVSSIEQLAPAATFAPQMVDWIAKFELFAPLMDMPARFSMAELTLVSVIVWGAVAKLIGRVPHE